MLCQGVVLSGIVLMCPKGLYYLQLGPLHHGATRRANEGKEGSVDRGGRRRVSAGQEVREELDLSDKGIRVGIGGQAAQDHGKG